MASPTYATASFGAWQLALPPSVRLLSLNSLDDSASGGVIFRLFNGHEVGPCIVCLCVCARARSSSSCSLRELCAVSSQTDAAEVNLAKLFDPASYTLVSVQSATLSLLRRTGEPVAPTTVTISALDILTVVAQFQSK